MNIRNTPTATDLECELLVVGCQEGAVQDAVQNALGAAGSAVAEAAAVDEFKARVGSRVVYPVSATQPGIPTSCTRRSAFRVSNESSSSASERSPTLTPTDAPQVRAA